MINYLAAMLLGFGVQSPVKSQKGVTMIEYALIAALIAIVVITSITLVGGQVDTAFDQIKAALITALT